MLNPNCGLEDHRQLLELSQPRKKRDRLFRMRRQESQNEIGCMPPVSPDSNLHFKKRQRLFGLAATPKLHKGFLLNPLRQRVPNLLRIALGKTSQRLGNESKSNPISYWITENSVESFAINLHL